MTDQPVFAIGTTGWVVSPAQAIVSHFAPARIVHETRTRFTAQLPSGRNVNIRKKDCTEHGGRRRWTTVKPVLSRTMQLSAQAKGIEAYGND